jgi:hypothetical protein
MRVIRRLRSAVGNAIWSGRRLGGDGLRATAERAGPAIGVVLTLLVQALLLPPRLALRFLRSVARWLADNAEAIARAVGDLIYRLGNVVTPERTLALVIVAAAGLLAGSQFADYTGVRIGTPEYAAVAPGAPAPLVSTAKAGSAHAWMLIPVAAVALLATIAAMGGRWRMARLASLAGLAGLAVALLVDRPKGLEEGAAAIDYSGAKATLLGGFYAEVAASAVLAICGILLADRLRAVAGSSHRRRTRRPAPTGLSYSALEGHG